MRTMDASKRLRFGLVLLLATVTPIVALTVTPAWVLPACFVLLAAWMGVTRIGRLTWTVFQVGVATIPQRLGSSTVVVVGIAGVVGVLVAILAIGAGFEQTLKQTGADDTVIVLGAGAQSEGASTLDNETISIISQAPQILKNREGQPVESPEQLIVATLPKKNSRLNASVPMRGVGEHVREVRPHIRITAGRNFKPGLRELIVGKGAHEKFAGLDVGSTVKFDGESWAVVGIFDSGDAHNSELWADTDLVGSTYRHTGGSTSLTLRLIDAGAFDAFKTGLGTDPRLKVDVETTRQYYNRQSQAFSRIIKLVGMTVGAIMAVGAIFGALNATYLAIARRTREIATLRAIGFRRIPVIVSVLLETMMLGAFGGAIGAAISWAIFDNFTAATLGTSGQVVFAFNVSPEVVWSGFKAALGIGFIGGLFPAARTAYLPIVTGLCKL